MRTLCRVWVLGVPFLCATAWGQSQPPPGTLPAARAVASAQSLEPDGLDDPMDTGTGTVPVHGHFDRVGRPPLHLRRVCDLRVFNHALYATHANTPLGSDGATVTRYDPGASGSPFSVALDWNRPGEPARGGGGGQGFLRVRSLGGRLFVPDTDPPYNGFGITDPGTEGYVFVSDPSGMFAPPRGPHARPPGPPSAVGRAGAGVLPRAYHVLDVASYHGHLYASTGSVPPREHAWTGPSPGALHVASPDLSRWTYTADHPHPWGNGVWRLTFMVRFHGRLYAGIQDYDGREPNDYVVFSTPAGSTAALTPSDGHPVRVTPRGGALTLRWYADHGRLWWIAVDRGTGVSLRVTDDGDTWHTVALPPEAGWPSDITRYRDALVVLTAHGLYRLEGEHPVLVAPVADTPRSPTPFPVNDVFCASPMGVFNNTLYAGGQRDGGLYRLVEDPAP